MEFAVESEGRATRDGHEKVPEAAGDLQVSAERGRGIAASSAGGGLGTLCKIGNGM